MKTKIGLLDILVVVTIIMLVLNWTRVLIWEWYWSVLPLAIYIGIYILVTLPFTIIELSRKARK